jgi:hypothetical protein
LDWQEYYFQDASILDAIIILEGLKSDLHLAEIEVNINLLDKIKPESYEFNKLDIIATAKNGILEPNELLELTINTVFYDSTEEYHVKYWIDDPSETSDSIFCIIKPNQPLIITPTTSGTHYISGQIKSDDKRQDWKRWNYTFFVYE